MKVRLEQCQRCKGEGVLIIRYHYKTAPFISTIKQQCGKCEGRGWDRITRLEAKDD